MYNFLSLFNKKKDQKFDNKEYKFKFIYTTYYMDPLISCNNEEYFSTNEIINKVILTTMTDLPKNGLHIIKIFNLANLRWFPLYLHSQDRPKQIDIFKKIETIMNYLDQNKINYQDIGNKYRDYFEETYQYFMNSSTKQACYEIPVPDDHILTIEQYGRDNNIDWINHLSQRSVYPSVEVYRNTDNRSLYYIFYEKQNLLDEKESGSYVPEYDIFND